jgi:phosphoribosyl-ATP pyrophosphohydrolase
VPSMSDGIKQPVVQELMAVIQSRKANPPPRSYTSSLFAGGVEKIGAKVLEEAREVVEAAVECGEAGRQHLLQEAADVVYHLLVLLAQRETTWSEVEAVLAARFGISGLDEKESRKS